MVASRSWLFGLLLLLVPVSAYGEDVRTVAGSRILLSDIVPNAPATASRSDFGPSPAPGASRLISRQEVQARLRRLGIDPAKIAMPDVVRMVGRGKELAPNEVSSLSSPLIRQSLPAGITLFGVEPAAQPVIVPPNAAPGSVLFPQWHRRSGRIRATVTVEFVDEGRVVARIPLSITVEMASDAGRADVAKGTSLQVVLTQGAVSITSSATTLSEGNIGDTVRVTIRATGRVVRALITSSTAGKVVGP